VGVPVAIEVLLVEDNPLDALTHQAEIRKAYRNARIETVERLADALHHLERHPVDIVFADLGLPDSQGLGTIEALVDGAGNTPVVALTGRDPDEEQQQRAIDMGAQDFLYKQMTLADVYRNCISNAIRRKRLEQETLQSALTDPLTGVLNRRALMDALDRALRRADSTTDVVLAFCDVDNVKRINDTYGHSVGDDALQLVAREIQDGVPGAAVGRLGGDEFAMVIRDLDEHDALAAIRELCVRGCGLKRLGPHGIEMSASWGVVVGDGDSDAQAMLTEVDRAVHRAKQQGGTVVVYDETMRRDDLLAEQQIGQLRSQIRLGLSEFELHFQEVVDTGTRHPVAYEGLLRWNHPHRGLLPAGAFIGQLQQSNLVPDIDHWVVRQAAGLLEAVPGRLHVNVSPVTLREPEQYLHLMRELAEVHDVAGRLVLEVTEDTLIEHADAGVRALLELQEMGFAIAIDDFGTGYSSFAYLEQLPVDWLKLDGQFLRQGSYSLIEGMAHIGRTLRIPIIVEGVETQEQHDWLAAGAIECGQGYFYHRPAREPWQRSSRTIPAAIPASRQRPDRHVRDHGVV